MKTKTSSTTDSMKRSPLQRRFLVIPLVLVCFASSPRARASCQQGCWGNFNTVLGEEALISLTAGLDNTAIGYLALNHTTTGDNNTAIGSGALYSNSTGGQNTATGKSALVTNTTGDSNTATGWNALFSNSTGTSNTATGSSALVTNMTGSDNTAIGAEALSGNTDGNDNTAVGFNALESNSASNNTATGVNALLNNTTGTQNTASGVGALSSNTIGSFNTANGLAALLANTTGNSNTADGINSLISNTTGNSNVAVGDRALSASTTGSNNIAVGAAAGINLTSGSNNLYFGNAGSSSGESNKIRIGTTGIQKATFIAGISGVTVPVGVGVVVGTDGKLGTVVSSERFKAETKPMGKASEAILALKPVTFRYKRELDPDGIPQFGLVAEQVEKVNPDLVARDSDGKPYTVRYEAVNAMLLNEFLKEHRTVEGLKKEIAALTATVKEQASQIQKVSAELQMRNPAPQMVFNNQ